MSWELSAHGHIKVPADADGQTRDQVAVLEIELAGRIREILDDPKYACYAGRLSGTYVTADLRTGVLHSRPAEPAVHRTGEARGL